MNSFNFENRIKLVLTQNLFLFHTIFFFVDGGKILNILWKSGKDLKIESFLYQVWDQYWKLREVRFGLSQNCGKFVAD